MGSLAAVDNDLRVGTHRVHTKDPKPTNNIQRREGLQALLVFTTGPKSLVCHPPSSSDAT